jgi:microcompartment protein CcmK/EutM
VQEGRAAGELLGRAVAPVDVAIVGIVDTVHLEGQPDSRRTRS